MDTITHFMHLASSVVGIIGCLILIYGAAIGSFHWLKAERVFWKGQDPRVERESLRHQLAYYLLLSLEFLIAAD